MAIQPLITFKNEDGSLLSLYNYNKKNNLNNFNAPLIIELCNNDIIEQKIRIASIQNTPYKLFDLAQNGNNLESDNRILATTQIFILNLNPKSTTTLTMTPCYETKKYATQNLELINYNFFLVIDDAASDGTENQSFQLKYHLACFKDDSNPLPKAIGTKRKLSELSPPPPPKRAPPTDPKTNQNTTRSFFSTILN